MFGSRAQVLATTLVTGMSILVAICMALNARLAHAQESQSSQVDELRRKLAAMLAIEDDNDFVLALWQAFEDEGVGLCLVHGDRVVAGHSVHVLFPRENRDWTLLSAGPKNVTTELPSPACVVPLPRDTNEIDPDAIHVLGPETQEVLVRSKDTVFLINLDDNLVCILRGDR